MVGRQNHRPRGRGLRGLRGHRGLRGLCGPRGLCGLRGVCGLTGVCPVFAEQPCRADDDGNQKDESAEPGGGPEEEPEWSPWKPPSQNPQPDAHLETAGGNSHAVQSYRGTTAL